MQQHNKQPDRSVERGCRGKTETTLSQTRRKALKTIAAGTAAAGAMALTGKWSKPVVDTIILPAHAQATNGAGPVGTTTPASCSPTIEADCYEITWDTVFVPSLGHDLTIVRSVRTTGRVNPAQGNEAITVTVTASVYNIVAKKIDTLHVTTKPDGSFEATQVYTDADNIADIDGVSAEGRCNTIEVERCSNPEGF